MGFRKGQRTVGAKYPGWRGQNIVIDFRFNEMAGAPHDYGNHLFTGSLGTTGAGTVNPTWISTEKGMALHVSGTTGTNAAYAEYGEFTWPYNDCTMEMMVRIFDKGGSPTPRQRVWATGDLFEVRWQLEDRRFGNDIMSGGSFGAKTPAIDSSSAWHHVIMTRDGTSDTGSSGAWMDSVLGEQVTTPHFAPSTGNFRIGHRPGANVLEGTYGDFAFIRFYRNIATDAQIAEMFRDPFPLVVHRASRFRSAPLPPIPIPTPFTGITQMIGITRIET